MKTTTKIKTTDKLDEEFHGAQRELLEALKFAQSEESDGEFIEACGRAVTIARKMIAIEDRLQELGEGHEDYGRAAA